MTKSAILKRPLPAMIVLGALALGGCSGTNVGSSWQCPLAQGGSCDSVAGADPAVPQAASAPRAAPVPQAASAADAAPADGMTIRAPLYRVRGGGPREAAAPPCEAGCGFDPFGWLVRLFGAAGRRRGAGHRPDRFRSAGARPANAGELPNRCGGDGIPRRRCPRPRRRRSRPGR